MNISEDALVAVAFVFERANGRLLSEDEQSEVVFHNLQGYDPELLATELRSAISEHAEVGPNYRSLAYWSLGKRFDKRLIPFFRERLAVEILDDLGTAYQIMIALDHLEEPVFSSSRNGSYSILDTDLNRRDAESYLNGHR